MASARAKVTAEGWRVGARYVVRGDTNTTSIKRGNIKRAQGFCPWSPPQEGARDQSSSAHRGLPSKGDARALHHQPAPALTLTTPCLISLLPSFSIGGLLKTTVRKINLTNGEKLRTCIPQPTLRTCIPQPTLQPFCLLHAILHGKQLRESSGRHKRENMASNCERVQGDINGKTIQRFKTTRKKK